jgi:hypothetical protein
MKIATFGARFFASQIERIEDGFVKLGHELTSDNPDLIYSNDPGDYDKAINLKKSYPNAKLLLNVLDLPPHYIDGSKYDISRYPKINNPNRDFNPLKLKNQLINADKITCICKEVQWQLKNWCFLDSEVIYNPIKDVSWLNLSENEKIRGPHGKKYKYLYVGRANDINKRFDIVARTILLAGDKPKDLAVIGSENPGFGHYYGTQNDQVLNLFYNSVEYFFFPSAFKSIGLPALESIVTKTKTVVCGDDPTTNEFWDGIAVSSNPSDIAEQLKSEEWNNKNQSFIEKYSPIYKKKFSGEQIAKNIIDAYNKS